MDIEMAEIKAAPEGRASSPSFLAALNTRLELAISNEDLTALKEAAGEWLELLNSKDDFLFEDLFLMSPVAKAVLAERRSAVAFLVHRCGFRLEAFHLPGCGCRLCSRLAIDRRFLQRHLDLVVRAASRPLYVLCAFPDSAISYCLNLRRALWRCQDRMSSSTWKSIVSDLEESIVTVLEVASNEQEAIQLLEEPGEGAERLEKILEIVDSGFRKVCAHPTLQAAVDREWYGEALPWDLRTISLPLCALFAAYCYFLLTPLAIVFPHPRLLRILRTPIIRYFSNCFSYWVTLILSVTAASVTHSNILMMCDPKEGHLEISHIEAWQRTLLVLLVALLLRFASAIWFCGMRLFPSGYDYLHFLGVLFYFLGSILVVIFFRVVPGLSSFDGVCNWLESLPDSDNLAGSCAAATSAYKRHPAVMAAIKTFSEPYILGTTIVGFGHLLYFVSAGHVLSTVRLMASFIIAVEKMIIDVAKWFIFCVIFFIAWTVALQTVYSNYRCSNQYFSSFGQGLTRLFWASLTMSGTSEYKLVGEVIKSRSWLETMVEQVGWIMYLLFFLVGAIILLNLLIALMAVTFQKIEDESESVITRRKTKVKLKFILWDDDLPAPFNLFYPIFLLSRLVWKMTQRLCSQAPETNSLLNQREPDLLQVKLWSLYEKYRGNNTSEATAEESDNTNELSA